MGAQLARCGLVEGGGPLGGVEDGAEALPLPNAVYARAIEAFDPTTEEAMRCVSRLLYWRHAAEHPSPDGFDHSVLNGGQRGATMAEEPRPGLDGGENETVETLRLTANASPVYLWATPTQWAAASHARDVFYAGRAAQGSQTLAGLPPTPANLRFVRAFLLKSLDSGVAGRLVANVALHLLGFPPRFDGPEKAPTDAFEEDRRVREWKKAAEEACRASLARVDFFKQEEYTKDLRKDWAEALHSGFYPSKREYRLRFWRNAVALASVPTAVASVTALLGVLDIDESLLMFVVFSLQWFLLYRLVAWARVTQTVLLIASVAFLLHGVLPLSEWYLVFLLVAVPYAGRRDKLMYLSVGAFVGAVVLFAATVYLWDWRYILVSLWVLYATNAVIGASREQEDATVLLQKVMTHYAATIALWGVTGIVTQLLSRDGGAIVAW